MQEVVIEQKKFISKITSNYDKISLINFLYRLLLLKKEEKIRFKVKRRKIFWKKVREREIPREHIKDARKSIFCSRKF